jgi:predicted metal-dependent enzyme (double-stranded beta helix superfamily)
MANARLPVFEKFISDLRAVWAAETDNRRRMEKAKPLVEQLVKDPCLKTHSANWPSTEGRKNLLLYVDPEHGFVVNAVVRMPGRTGSVHDHADAWVL